MTGHGQKLSRQHEVFIATLLTTPTVKQAAKAAGIAEATAGRWMKDPGFKAAYAEARRQALQEQIARYRQQPNGSTRIQALLDGFRRRMYDISTFFKELKGGYTQWFNERHDRYGTLWAERFKSVLLEAGRQ